MSDRARDDLRLAWLIVGASGAVTLVLLVLLAMWGVRAITREVEQAHARAIDQNERNRQMAEAARQAGFDPIVPTASTPAPPDTARPIGAVARWLDADDYPPGARRRGEEGRVRVTLAIDRDGRATGCSVTLASGYSSLDNGTCAVFLRKGRFEPAPGGPLVRRWMSPPIRWVPPR